MDRDYFSWEGYQALYDYYDEFPDFDLDVVAVCCDVDEYTEEEVLKEYSYMLEREEDQDEDDYLNDLIEELQDHTTIIKLDNGSFLVWSF